MRVPRSTLTLAIVLLFLSAPLAQAAPPESGESSTVNANEVWTETATMNGHLTVTNGATLTIQSDITMEPGSSITVDEGASLVMDNGSLISEELNSGLLVNNMGANLMLNFGDLAETGVIQLQFDHEITTGETGWFNITMGNTTVDASGSDTVQFDAPLNATNLTVTFDAYYFTPTYLLQAQAIYGGGNVETLQAPNILANNAPLYWFQSGFDLSVNGHFEALNGELRGAKLSCSMSCSFTGTQVTGSAPIHVADATSISVLDSIITGSRTDEDIILHDQATITYTNSVGTGGTTDAWIRLLSERVLRTNIPNGSLDIYDMGWGASDWNDLTDENGDIVLVPGLPTNEHKRIVEWMDGNGVEHQEEATITLSITSNWGTFSTTVDAPTLSEGTINVDLPLVSVTKISPETTVATVNRSIGLMLTVENSGAADATANFRCYVDGEDADTAPSTITASLSAGEVKDIPVTWYVYADGSQSLTCKPFLPVALENVANEVANLAGVDSDPVVWTYAEETEDAPIIIWVIAIVGFMVFALIIASQKRQQEKEYTTYPVGSETEHEDDSNPEGDEESDAEIDEAEDEVDETEEEVESEHAEDEVDETEEEVESEHAEDEVDETEDESTGSIYDLQPEDED